jgi:hypothetical protein
MVDADDAFPMRLHKATAVALTNTSIEDSPATMSAHCEALGNAVLLAAVGPLGRYLEQVHEEPGDFIVKDVAYQREQQSSDEEDAKGNALKLVLNNCKGTDFAHESAPQYWTDPGMVAPPPTSNAALLFEESMGRRVEGDLTSIMADIERDNGRTAASTRDADDAFEAQIEMVEGFVFEESFPDFDDDPDTLHAYFTSMECAEGGGDRPRRPFDDAEVATAKLESVKLAIVEQLSNTLADAKEASHKIGTEEMMAFLRKCVEDHVVCPLRELRKYETALRSSSDAFASLDDRDIDGCGDTELEEKITSREQKINEPMARIEAGTPLSSEEHHACDAEATQLARETCEIVQQKLQCNKEAIASITEARDALMELDVTKSDEWVSAEGYLKQKMSDVKTVGTNLETNMAKWVRENTLHHSDDSNKVQALQHEAEVADNNELLRCGAFGDGEEIEEPMTLGGLLAQNLERARQSTAMRSEANELNAVLNAKKEIQDELQGTVRKYQVILRSKRIAITQSQTMLKEIAQVCTQTRNAAITAHETRMRMLENRREWLLPLAHNSISVALHLQASSAVLSLEKRKMQVESQRMTAKAALEEEMLDMSAENANNILKARQEVSAKEGQFQEITDQLREATAVLNSLRSDFELESINSEMESLKIAVLSTAEPRFCQTNVEEVVVAKGIAIWTRKQAAIYKRNYEQKMGLLQLADGEGEDEQKTY